jgi:uncharacterized membrane protein YgcG
VLAGKAIAPSEQARLERAVRNAEAASKNLSFAVYLGPVEGSPRVAAERFHAALGSPETSVLVLCDPEQRALEIVTGAQARRTLTDAECALAAASMESSFAAGDIIGGLVVGIQQLGEAARAPRTLHTRRVS